MKASSGRLSADGSVQARRRGGALGAVTAKSFLCPSNFVVLRKNCFKRMIKVKIFAPQTLKPGYGPGSTKIVSAIIIFYFEALSASRCCITSKSYFYKSPIGGPCKHFGGAQS